MKSKKKTKPALWTQMPGGLKPRMRRLTQKEWEILVTGKKPKPIKPVSDSRSKQMQEYLKARRKRLQGKLCEARGTRVAGEWVCSPQDHMARDVHHQKGKLGPLLNDQRFWMGLCRQSHSWIDHHRTLAKQLGWILPNWNSMPKD